MTIYGRTEPRLCTPDPYPVWTEENTLGFACIRFAKVMLGIDLMPWQKYHVIRCLALDADGRLLYQTVLTLVGRQSGKTTLLKVIVLFLMFVGRRVDGPVGLVLGAAQDLKIAMETWKSVVQMVQADPELRSKVANIAKGAGAQELLLKNQSRYLITSTTGEAGRGFSVDLLLFDELRSQSDFTSWSSLTSTTLARPQSLILATSNAGTDNSVVLNNLRESALAGADPSLCIMEWSAPDGADVDDPEMWAYGVPALGYSTPVSKIAGQRAVLPPNQFRTEVMCQRVTAIDSVITPESWAAGDDNGLTDWEAFRGRVMLVIDASLDLSHVTLCAAAKGDGGKFRGDIVATWSNTNAARQELPDIIASIKPHSVGWFSGPMNALAPDLQKIKGTRTVEIKGADVSMACQGLAELVSSRRLVHSDDAVLAAHVTGASKLATGDGYRFTRKGGQCDAAYAIAGAVHLARTAKVVGKQRIIVAA